jgi:hypothetical protein
MKQLGQRFKNWGDGVRGFVYWLHRPDNKCRNLNHKFHIPHLRTFRANSAYHAIPSTQAISKKHSHQIIRFTLFITSHPDFSSRFLTNNARMLPTLLYNLLPHFTSCRIPLYKINSYHSFKRAITCGISPTELTGSTVFSSTKLAQPMT